MSQANPGEVAPDAQESQGQLREPEILAGIGQKPLKSRLKIYAKLSGPGWLQSAITLGGGSLASSLFLGALAGFSLMWLQPVAMILGIVMLSAIGYVALTTGRRPFRAINEHVNPVLGWGWAVATALANIVWCLPQFSLGVASVRLNLLPSALGPQAMPVFWAKAIAAAVILAICVFIIWFYDKGSRGIRIFEWVLKGMVGVVIVCFFGVVIRMSVAGVLNWGGIFGGLIPDLSMLSEPAKTFSEHLAATGHEYAGYWKTQIVDMQRLVMISAFATAVGINMTFLLPYSMLAKGWRKNARGLAVFDLSTGLFIPFILATGCVVIASATQFHTEYHPGLLGENNPQGVFEKAPASQVGKYTKILDGRLKEGMARTIEDKEALAARLKKLEADHAAVVKRRAKADKAVREQLGAQAFAALCDEKKAELRTQHGCDDTAKAHLGEAAFEKMQRADLAALATLRAGQADGDELTSELEKLRHGLPPADKRMAAMLVKRSAFDLAASLRPLTGDFFSHYVFGIGVIGMAISSIIILMLISGFVVCEMLGIPPKGNAHRLACMLPVVGVLGPFVWTGGKAQFWLAVPTSVFCGALIPIAYAAFFCLMNSKSLLGKDMPRGGRRIAWNSLMLLALAVVIPGSLWIIWNKGGAYGVAALAVFLALLIVVQVKRKAKPLSEVTKGEDA